jgi:two-component system, OmpR family, alkaline phosphatase synthesis response regulator PhoP
MKRILVIDDDTDMVELLKNRLTRHHYEVTTASEGVEGLAKAKMEKPDLIILDVAMPVMDGYTFVQDFKHNVELHTIPVIVLTGREELEDLFRQEGFTNFVSKPFQEAELLKNIEQNLSCL